MESRLREFDFIRAIAALSVIAIHVTGGLVTSNHIAYVWNQGMRYAVPLFIILSGFLLLYAERKKPLDYPTFLQKRFKKIMIPYLFWTCLYVLYSNRHSWGAWLSGDIWQPFILVGKHLLMGTGYVHLYFLLIMLQLYLLYPLLRSWLEKDGRSLMLVSFIITLLSQTLIYLHQLHVLVLPSIGIPYVSLFPLWIFYFVFGMAASKQKENWEPLLSGKVVPLALAWLVSLGLLIIDSRLTQTYASSLKPTVILYCFASYFLFYVVALRFKSTKMRVGLWLDWLSTHSFMIFLLHPFILSLLIYPVKWVPQLWKGTSGMILLYLATTFCTLLFTHLLSKIPASVWIGGVYAGKPTKPDTLPSVSPQ